MVVPLFTTPRPAGGFASGTVTVTDPSLLAALRADPGGFHTDLRERIEAIVCRPVASRPGPHLFGCVSERVIHGNGRYGDVFIVVPR